MKHSIKTLSFLFLLGLLTSCVSKKEYLALQTELQNANNNLSNYDQKLATFTKKLNRCESEKGDLKGNLNTCNSKLKLREEQIQDLKDQINDIRGQRDKQVEQVGDLTVLSQSANENIKETLSQLENKDKYINLLQQAKTKADSINLALAVNLKGVLSDGIEDNDVEVKVDKTVVFVNLSDKMLYTSGSANITNKAHTVLGKIAKIIKSRPDLEVMVEGYTDNVPIKDSCNQDNWDLSVRRATSVVRTLQKNHGVDPNRLIAAGRGEYNVLASNDTSAGRSINRRTRIIILPKLDQFYDLLNPNNVPK